MSLDQLAVWALKLSRRTRLAIESLVSAAVFYFAAILSNSIVESAKIEDKHILWLYGITFVFFLTLVFFLFNYFSRGIDIVRERQNQQKSTISHAYNLCDRILVNYSADLEGCNKKPNQLAKAITSPLGHIRSIVSAAYQVFESAYGRNALPDERVDFEVTFMTKSFEDEEITIPAAANSNSRYPRSMVLRENNKKIYDQTVTAKVYRMPRPQIQIISSTDSSDYMELYPGQKNRIRSSIILPVLSNKNRLLGTLVVHCDKADFFLSKDLKYWEDLLEVFAKRIAVEAILVECLMEIRETDEEIKVKNLKQVIY